MKKGKLLVHGSFLTEAHILSTNFHASYYIKKIGSSNVVWVNGTCNNLLFKLGPMKNKQCGDYKVNTNYSSATVNTPDWRITITPQPVYFHINGPSKRIDIRVVKKTNIISAGILGQSFTLAREGKVDDYPESGEFTTYSMAEGAMDGNYMDYKLFYNLDTNGKYSLFNTKYNEDVQKIKEQVADSIELI